MILTYYHLDLFACILYVVAHNAIFAFV